MDSVCASWCILAESSKSHQSQLSTDCLVNPLLRDISHPLKEALSGRMDIIKPKPIIGLIEIIHGNPGFPRNKKIHVVVVMSFQNNLDKSITLKNLLPRVLFLAMQNILFYKLAKPDFI